MDAEPKMKKTKTDYNRTYYMNHKAENHKRQMLSCIRTHGRVPHLYTVRQRKLSQEIAPNKILEMRVLIGNMI